MSEPKPDPLRRLNNPESSAKPISGPDQEVLEIIERAAREMATRRPRTPSPAPIPSPVPAPAPNDIFSEPVRSDPIKELAQIPIQEPIQETVQETVQETAHVTGRDLAEEFDEEIAKQSIEPAEELPPAPEIKAAEEFQSDFVLHSIDKSESAEDSAPFDTGGFFATTDESKPLDVREPLAKIEPVADVEPIDLLAAAVAPVEPMPPAAAIAPASPKFAPPITPPEQPKYAPAPKPAAARPMYDDHFRLALTTVQSVALGVAIFAFVVAAFGMAARGWVVAHDWSCRVGMATNVCPPPPPPKSLGRAEIPS